MPYICCGANLFRQWLSEVFVIKEFTEIQNTVDSNINIQRARFSDINWSYNIVEWEKNYYIVGSWNNNIELTTRIGLPINCTIKEKTENEERLIVIGNDFHLIIINPKLHKMWLMNIEDMNKVKEIKLSTEAPVQNPTKKMKIDDHVIKARATNNTCLLLTHYGVVYEGFLPSMVPTNHCTGTIIDIQCGFEHFVLLTDAGHVYTWGNGRRLQLGHGDLTNLDTPTELEALAGIKITKIAAGGWHTLVLSEHGDLYCWGWNDTGQLGIKSDTSTEGNKREVMKGYPYPTVVDLYDDNNVEVPLNVIDIACGSRHSAILLEDNSVWTSGNNKYGQLGNPNVVEQQIYKKVYQSNSNCKLMCGLWSTLISCN